MSLEHATEIPFTQYVAPYGTKRAVYFDASPETHALALALIAKGLRFEAEVLSTGAVSLTVYNPMLDQDIAIQISVNGPGIENAVDVLVREATEVSK